MIEFRSFLLPAEDPSKTLWLQVEKSTRDLIEPLLLGPPIAIGAIAGALEIDVLSSVLPSSISGQIRLRNEDKLYEIKVNLADPPVRQRFTVAHEIAHYLLHRKEIDGDGITDTILFRSKLSDKKEAEANKLAAMLLLPWDPVIDWAAAVHGASVGPSILQEIAAAWKVSALTAGYRFGF